MPGGRRDWTDAVRGREERDKLFTPLCEGFDQPCHLLVLYMSREVVETIDVHRG